MKFTPGQLILILAILVAGVIAAHVFAPGAAAAVISIATTVIGVLFVNKHDDPKDPPEGGAGTGAGKLTVIAGGLGVLVFVLSLGALGCGSTFAELEDAAKNGDENAKIAKCRGDARAAFFVDQKSEDEALAVFDACVKKIGAK